MKTIFIILMSIIIILPIAYYLVSPAFIVNEIEEKSPLEALEIKDSMNTMDAATKAEFEKQVGEMKDKIIVAQDEMPPKPEIISQGEFKPGAHDVKGKALLISADAKKVLRFEDFETINGPNLHIYLSTELGNGDFIDLGEIKGTKGSFNYNLDSSIDTEKYNKVLVWCVPFGVLFSFADIA